MRRIYDFRCPCGELEEHYIDLGIDDLPLCNKCGKTMQRVISPVRFTLEGVSGDFPTASDKWVKQRKEKIASEKRERQSHGEPS